MTALLSKSKDASMRGFNKLTQSIFDVKTAVFGKKMPEKVSEVEEPSNNIVDFKVLNKPSSIFPFVDENKEIVFVDLNDNVGGGGNISTVGDQATTILDVVLYCSAVEE